MLFRSDFIYSFSMSIPLGISRGRVSINNLQLTTVFFEHFTIELKTIVRDEHVRNSKPSNDVLPDESFDIHIFDVGWGSASTHFVK